MAKSGQTSWFEQNVEKIAVGVCLLLLAIGLVYWIPGSPRELEVTGAPNGAAPDEVDEALRVGAKRVTDAAANQKVVERDVPMWENERERLARAQELTGAAHTTALAVRAEPIEVEGSEINIPDRMLLTVSQIAKLIPKPTQTHTTAQTVLPIKQDATDTNLAVAASAFPWETLHTKWNNLLDDYGARMNEPVTPVAVEVQMQVREEGGQWSEAREIEPYRLPILDRSGQETKLPTPEQLAQLDDEQREAAVRLLRNNIEYILEPTSEGFYWPPDRQLTIANFLPENPISKAAMEEGAEAEEGGRLDARRRLMEEEEEFRRPRPREFMEEEDGRRFREFEDEEDFDRRRPSRRRTTPRPQPRRVVTPVEPLPAPEAKPVPRLSEQIRQGKVLFWAMHTDVKSGKQYRYRMRLVFINPLLGQMRIAQTAEDARKVTVRSPWSDWSNATAVPKMIEFFVTGRNPAGNQVAVSVFTRRLGQWIRQRFLVRAGESIGEQAQVEVFNPVLGKVVPMEVDFSTGATAVEFDFLKKYVTENQIARESVEMIYLTGDSELETRIKDVDEQSERYRRLLKQAKASEQQAAGIQAAAADGER
ncbi:MAG: hypothetical protein ACLFVU_02220 [Phycisphaerae bacterium]